MSDGKEPGRRGRASSYGGNGSSNRVVIGADGGIHCGEQVATAARLVAIAAMPVAILAAGVAGLRTMSAVKTCPLPLQMAKAAEKAANKAMRI